jgi:hypothetical protein
VIVKLLLSKVGCAGYRAYLVFTVGLAEWLRAEIDYERTGVIILLDLN